MAVIKLNCVALEDRVCVAEEFFSVVETLRAIFCFVRRLCNSPDVFEGCLLQG